jgi:hypothetical protein
MIFDELFGGIDASELEAACCSIVVIEDECQRNPKPIATTPPLEKTNQYIGIRKT